MAVKLRLSRMGRKKRPFYRIVAIDSRTARDGRYIENLGYYNPLTEPAEMVIDREKALKWLNHGAIPSDTVRNFLQREGIILEWTLTKQGLEPEKVTEELKKWQVLQLERKKRLEAKAAMKTRENEATKEKSKPAEQPVAEAESATE